MQLACIHAYMHAYSDLGPEYNQHNQKISKLNIQPIHFTLLYAYILPYYYYYYYSYYYYSFHHYYY